MSKYTQEQYDQLPSFVQENLEKVGDDWTDKGLLRVKQTADNLNTQLEDERKKNADLSDRVTNIEKEQQEKIEAAKKAALEEARSKGDVEAIEKRYQEQMADLEKRTAERVKNETIAEFQQERDKDSAKNTAMLIAKDLAVDEDASEPLFELIKNRVTFEKGERVFRAADGSATAMNEKEFIDAVKSDPRYKYLIKATQTTRSRSFVNQSDRSGVSDQKPRSNFTNNAASKAERVKRIEERMARSN